MHAVSAASVAGTSTNANVDAIVVAYVHSQTRNSRNVYSTDDDMIDCVWIRRIHSGALSEQNINSSIIIRVAAATGAAVGETLYASEER